MFATAAIRWTYRRALKPWYFRRDPEDVHDLMCRVGEKLGRYGITRGITDAIFDFEDPSLAQDVLGVRFRNPIGLSAGFDKDARLVDIIPSVGFGFEEVGSITGEPCAGNPRPRLWRLPRSKGLVVYYGLKNDGADVVAARLRGRSFGIPVGTSIARTNDAAHAGVEEGIEDYAKAFRLFADVGAYFTVNISCPNTCGGEPYTQPERLDLLLTALDRIKTRKPVLLKMPADLSYAQTRALIETSSAHRVHGFIFSNLTKKFDRPEIVQTEITSHARGGISGRPAFAASNELLSQAYGEYGSRFVFVASGGVFTAEDAYEKIRRGASLVQLITGMIFEGPQLVGEINRGLVRLFARDGFANVREAVGAAHR